MELRSIRPPEQEREARIKASASRWCEAPFALERHQRVLPAFDEDFYQNDFSPQSHQAAFQAMPGEMQVARYAQNRNSRRRPLQKSVWSSDLYTLSAYNLVTC